MVHGHNNIAKDTFFVNIKTKSTPETNNPRTRRELPGGGTVGRLRVGTIFVVIEEDAIGTREDHEVPHPEDHEGHDHCRDPQG